MCKDLHLKCFKRRRAQELTDANCTARMQRAKLLLHMFPQYATDFVFFTDKKVLLFNCSLHLTIGRTKSVADCGNFWRRSVAFSSVRALRGLPLPGRLFTVPVSRNFLNSLLTPCFVFSFSQEIRPSTSLLCSLSNTNFLSKSCPRRLLPCWLLTNTAVCCDKFPMSQIDCKSK